MLVKNYRLSVAIFAVFILMGAQTFAAETETDGMLKPVIVPCTHSAGDHSGEGRENICTRINKCLSSLCARSKGCFAIFVKTALDAAVLYTTIKQIETIDVYKTATNAIICGDGQAACINNSRDQMRSARDAYYTDIILTAGFSGVALIFDAVSFVKYLGGSKDVLLDSDAGIVLGGSFFASVLSAIGAYSANGVMLVAAANYKAGMPDSVMEALSAANKSGIPVLILDTVAGLPGAVLLCIFAAQR